MRTRRRRGPRLLGAGLAPLPRDKVALAGGAFMIFLLFAAFVGAPLAAHFLGHGPNDQFARRHRRVRAAGRARGRTCRRSRTPAATTTDTADPRRRRDARPRRVPARSSTARRSRSRSPSCATIIGMFVGVMHRRDRRLLRRLTDTVVSRMTEIVMAFPLPPVRRSRSPRRSATGSTASRFGLSSARACHARPRDRRSSAGSTRRASCARRCCRCARRSSSRPPAWSARATARIIRSHLLPHLVAPIIVSRRSSVATNILLEAGLSFLGVGIQHADRELGQPALDGADYYLDAAVADGLARARRPVTTLAFNLLGDGLRDAFDPRGDARSRLAVALTISLRHQASERGVAHGGPGSGHSAREVNSRGVP